MLVIGMALVTRGAWVAENGMQFSSHSRREDWSRRCADRRCSDGRRTHSCVSMSTRTMTWHAASQQCVLDGQRDTRRIATDRQDRLTRRGQAEAGARRLLPFEGLAGGAVSGVSSPRRVAEATGAAKVGVLGLHEIPMSTRTTTCHPSSLLIQHVDADDDMAHENWRLGARRQTTPRVLAG
jgi:hypothetical protein